MLRLRRYESISKKMESGVGVFLGGRVDPQRGSAELSGVSYLLRGSNPLTPRQIQPCIQTCFTSQLTCKRRHKHTLEKEYTVHKYN